MLQAKAAAEEASAGVRAAAQAAMAKGGTTAPFAKDCTFFEAGFIQDMFDPFIIL